MEVLILLAVLAFNTVGANEMSIHVEEIQDITHAELAQMNIQEIVSFRQLGAKIHQKYDILAGGRPFFNSTP